MNIKWGKPNLPIKQTIVVWRAVIVWNMESIFLKHRDNSHWSFLLVFTFIEQLWFIELNRINQKQKSRLIVLPCPSTQSYWIFTILVLILLNNKCYTLIAHYLSIFLSLLTKKKQKSIIPSVNKSHYEILNFKIRLHLFSQSLLKTNIQNLWFTLQLIYIWQALRFSNLIHLGILKLLLLLNIWT